MDRLSPQAWYVGASTLPVDQWWTFQVLNGLTQICAPDILPSLFVMLVECSSSHDCLVVHACMLGIYHGRCVMGNCFSLQKDHESALKFFQRALQLDSHFTYAHTLCGHEYVPSPPVVCKVCFVCIWHKQKFVLQLYLMWSRCVGFYFDSFCPLPKFLTRSIWTG
jgi:hypothetical protein